jgi:hypothetical protein
MRERVMKKIMLAKIVVPAELELTEDDLSNVPGLRRYCHLQGVSLPGDIEVTIETYTDGHLVVIVNEDPNLPEQVE